MCHLAQARNDGGYYCPWSVKTLAQVLLSRARFCLRHARITWSPSSICARQNRETSRAHPGSGRPLCAEAAETMRRKGTASRNLVILNALVLINAQKQK